MNIAVVFAGGSGIRMGAGIPKQFLEIEGKPILIHTLTLFEHHAMIDKIYIAMLSDYIPYTQQLVEEYRIKKVCKIIPGGETSQDSIYNALVEARKDNPGDSVVLIHDGVRPYVSYDVISKNIESVKENGNAITSSPCVETVLLSRDGVAVDDVPLRKETFFAQAPQSFYLDDIISYHNQVRATEEGYTDIVDACTLCRKLGVPTYVVKGNRGNIKVTTPEDVYLFRGMLSYKANEQFFGYGLTNRVNSQLSLYCDNTKTG